MNTTNDTALDYLTETVGAARAKLMATGETDVAGVTAAIFLVNHAAKLAAADAKARLPTPEEACRAIMREFHALGYTGLVGTIRERSGCMVTEAHGVIQRLEAEGYIRRVGKGGAATIVLT